MQIATQSALVAGGGSGIGAAVARHLAGLGAKVALLDVNLESAEAVARECDGLALECDIAGAESAGNAIAAARAAHGPARILVNCAGILLPGRILGKDGPLPLDAFRRVIEVNLIGAFNLLRLAAADMATLAPLGDGERGVVINTSSIAAYEGQIGQIAYATSKAGMAGMTLPAARDLARHGIRVLSVAPGLVATPMITGLPQEVQDALAGSIPFPQRLAEPAEVARLVQHMIENVMLNGEVVRLDGALRMPPK
ncbi:MAG TPA: SDR family NAD(P)-dependent oxidoreductase [Dongiaceae bacterium]|jgi:NAD(P)-dependent dehydrogenase (short-subunit alcohol dehydrogenase family)|nr:SDR family NAD(P)-dependent oxidoreductase [Dongiaceae bacterium]